MNKSGNGISSTVVGVAILLIFVAIVLLFIIGPDAILPNAAHAGERVVDTNYAGVNKDDSKNFESQSNKDVDVSYDNILSALRSNGKGPCIVAYSPLAKDFKKFKITLSKAEQGIYAQ